MGWRFNSPFKRRVDDVNDVGMDHTREGVGVNGFGAPLSIQFSPQRNAPGTTDNAGYFAYETYLSPRWSPIGGGIQNKRDIGTTPPAYAVQGALVAEIGSPGILSGAFVSGPLTNVSSTDSSQPVNAVSSFAIPAA